MSHVPSGLHWAPLRKRRDPSVNSIVTTVEGIDINENSRRRRSWLHWFSLQVRPGSSEAGYELWVYDNLQRRSPRTVPAGRLIDGDLHDGPRLVQTLTSGKFEAVMHFAAFALVGESVTDPAKYYHNNVAASLTLLDAMRDAGVWRLVFLLPRRLPMAYPIACPYRRRLQQAPTDPYGFTKLVIERALADYAHAYGLGYAALRYFNAAGASPEGTIGEDHKPESHLIPLVLQVALGQREQITVFGDDYPTADGTCIRDYIHVDDLGAAHVRALERFAGTSR